MKRSTINLFLFVGAAVVAGYFFFSRRKVEHVVAVDWEGVSITQP